MRLLRWILNHYEYGTCHGAPARRRIRTGQVEFILWEAGQNGHKYDAWYEMNNWHWDKFKPTPKDTAP